MRYADDISFLNPVLGSIVCAEKPCIVLVIRPVTHQSTEVFAEVFRLLKRGNDLWFTCCNTVFSNKDVAFAHMEPVDHLDLLENQDR